MVQSSNKIFRVVDAFDFPKSRGQDLRKWIKENCKRKKMVQKGNFPEN